MTAIFDLMVRIMGQRIMANASLPVLKLMDRDRTLGLNQDALDNLASLAKDMILKVFINFDRKISEISTHNI